MQFIDFSNNSCVFKWNNSLINTIQSRKFAGQKIHSGIIIDISGSMGESINNEKNNFFGEKSKLQVVIESLNLYLDFAKVLIDSGIEMKLTIVTFSTRTELFYKSENPMTIHDIEILSKKLNTLRPTHSTIMAPAINELLRHEDPNFKNTFIIMTDGYADDFDNIMKNNNYKEKMQGAIGIGSAANYEESLLNYISSKETTYGGYNSEELKKGIIGFLLTDLMCIARDIQIRFSPDINIFTPENIIKDADGFTIIKIDRLLLDEIKTFYCDKPCEYEISYRDRTTGNLVIFKRTSENIIEDKGSCEAYCKFYTKYRTDMDSLNKLKELYKEMETIDFDVSSPLYIEWIELVKQIKELIKIKNTRDFNTVGKQSAVNRTFSSQIRSVGKCVLQKP